MKKNCLIQIEENGRAGHCSGCGETKELITVDGSELNVCKECFLKNSYIQGQFFMCRGIEHATVRIIT